MAICTAVLPRFKVDRVTKELGQTASWPQMYLNSVTLRCERHPATVRCIYCIVWSFSSRYCLDCTSHSHETWPA
ncbi:hypothetical protein K437DRAFT_259200 [Tilletiaria anomala UBC 951]|uniref:Uncharacterized protein n=1 Tax=Tilletiaria anomala (strain ATCC 24038 / CBS 436.72 / UBC 951) TaxID=1037660 RepID=A0A066VFK7_TILAU|nr:uncharacterized protein K437DRAFT_259200 [Tilletiaria anomala UBC 951]KDN39093.1 hypothetical protein K437DRAFT_259200 [Tilletiaria anomala UBC 951]